MAVLRRAWALTRGRFWPTFGLYLLGSLLASGVAQLPAQLFLRPDQSQSGAMTLVGGLFSLLASLATAIWQVCYITTMYRDQRTRTDVMAGGVPVR